MSENHQNNKNLHFGEIAAERSCLVPINPLVWTRVTESLSAKYGHQITMFNPDAVRLYSGTCGQTPVLVAEYMGVCPLYGNNDLISLADDTFSSLSPEEIVAKSSVGIKFLRFMEVVKAIYAVGQQIMIESEGKISDIGSKKDGQEGFQVAVVFHFADKGILARPPLPDLTQTRYQLDEHFSIYQAAARHCLDQEQIILFFDRYQDESCYPTEGQRKFPLTIERDNELNLLHLTNRAWSHVQAIYPFYIVQRLSQHQPAHQKMFDSYFASLRRRDLEDSRDILESVFDLMWSAVSEDLRSAVDPLRAFNGLNQIFQLRQRLARGEGIAVIDRYADYLSPAYIDKLKQRLTSASSSQQPINIEEIFDLTEAFKEIVPYPSSSIEDILSALEFPDKFDALACQIEARRIYDETAADPNCVINNLKEGNRFPKEIRNYLVELIKTFGPGATRWLIRQYLTFDQLHHEGALAIFVERFNPLLGLMNRLNPNLNTVPRLEINLSRPI